MALNYILIQIQYFASTLQVSNHIVIIFPSPELNVQAAINASDWLISEA